MGRGGGENRGERVEEGENNRDSQGEMRERKRQTDRRRVGRGSNAS